MITSKFPVRLPRAFLVMLVSSLILLAVLSGKSVMAIEEPAYHVVEQIDKIEIREYAPYLVAETLVEDEFDRNAAVSKGFRRLFRYIQRRQQYFWQNHHDCTSAAVKAETGSRP